ncbi:hypothetical protein [Sphingobacterium sp. LRF_L2]|uniref:hypothetical protein n=1 Tax=Sphingobacterium sp. LRF_L2 TaxID=3369421 RepID=UPI003F63B564
MDNNVSDYFRASEELVAKSQEANVLRQRTKKLHLPETIDIQLQEARQKVDEFVEIFTWETQDTDLIRSAFLEIAKNTLLSISHSNKINTESTSTAKTENLTEQLAKNIRSAFQKALLTKGRYIPRIELPKDSDNWSISILKDYLRDMQRQLQDATFDNLLEAVTYFEKSTLLLSLQLHTQRKSQNY